MAKEYRSEALAAVHETAFGMTEAGVMAKRTMREFDEMLSHADRGDVAGGDPRAAAEGECEPSGLCPISQCDHRVWSASGNGARSARGALP